MAESGDRPAVWISQKRLSIVLGVLGLLGCLLLGLAWWDTAENTSWFITNSFTIILVDSNVRFETGYDLEGAWYSLERDSRNPDWEWFGFLLPYYRPGVIVIPIYLLILAYLATLFLIWIVLMNRLARRWHLRENRLSNERA
jgi:hypothetical protein